MQVNFYNFAKLHDETLRSEIKERLSKIVDTNAFVEGEYNNKFEAQFAELQQAKHCALVANGTDAIEIALQAYDIGQGDKVGVQAISFFASAEAIYNVGATPIFIDVEPRTGLMCTQSLQNVVNKHDLKAIIPVHIYGLPVDIEGIEKICHPKGIKIVEDGAQSQGGFYLNGKPIGSSKNLTTYSFYPTKNLGAFGDAGAILTQDSSLFEKICSIRNHGRSPSGHALIGRNSRCDHMQAAILHAKLKKLDELNKSRKSIAQKMIKAFSSLPIKTINESYVDYSSWHLFPVQLESADQKASFMKFMEENKIICRNFYEKSLSQESPLIGLDGEFSKADNFALTTTCLPMHPFIIDEQIDYMSKMIAKFYA